MTVSRSPRLTFARFVKLPENQSGLFAVQRVLDSLSLQSSSHASNPFYLHGATGTGKTHLVTALIEEITRRRPDIVVNFTAAGDWRTQFHSSGVNEPSASENGESDVTDWVQTARRADLLVVEDVQFLPDRIAVPFCELFDDLNARHVQMVYTSALGPNELCLPARLRSRLASGLVVTIAPLQVTSRFRLLEDKAQRGQLAVSRDVLYWLSEHLTGGGRQLDGALAKLEVLCHAHDKRLNVATVAAHFHAEFQANRPSLEKIVTRVGSHFRVEPRQLQSVYRGRNVLLPRQVGMYLARQLTQLSLQQIGAYFGGRDHTTVLHACRKVAKVINIDRLLCGTIRQIEAELT